MWLLCLSPEKVVPVFYFLRLIPRAVPRPACDTRPEASPGAGQIGRRARRRGGGPPSQAGASVRLEPSRGTARRAPTDRPNIITAELLSRDRPPPNLGDLHPDDCPFATADVKPPALHDGIPINHRPSRLIDGEASANSIASAHPSCLLSARR